MKERNPFQAEKILTWQPGACHSTIACGPVPRRITDIPRRKYMGRRLGDPPASEAEHFVQCLPEHAILGTVVDGLTDLELGFHKIAAQFGVATGTVQRIARV